MANKLRVFFGEDQPFNWTVGLEAMINDIPNHSAMAMVEVGSFSGVSTEVFARNFQVVHAVDVWEPYSEVPGPDVICLARQLFNEVAAKNPNIKTVLQKSPGAAASFPDGSLDFVYIDAGHGFFDVVADIGAWWPKVRDGGYIGGHDYHQPGVFAAVSSILSTPTGLYPDTSWLKRKVA